MHSGKKSLRSGSFSPGLALIYRRRNGTIIVACLFGIVFTISFINMSASTGYSHHIYKKDTSVSEIRQVHECHCLVNVSLPLETKNEDNERTRLVSNDIVEDYRTAPRPHKNPFLRVPDYHTLTQHSKNKPLFRRTIDDHVLKSITLKPNFTRLINASQTITTVHASYILENPTLCSSVQNLAILIIVHTSPDHKRRRFTIRNTWANDGFYRRLGNVRILFLLGKAKAVTTKVQTDIENEFNRYGDILQGDFIDDYHNLTLKGVMAYKWLTERCRNANLILKVDDDISVNMFKFFIDYFPKYRSENMSIICNHILAETMGIIRQNTSKWYVENNHFRGLGTYPTDYCSGFFVLFTNDLIPALYSSSKVTPFFWVDDVYLYGLVPGNVPGVKYIGLKGHWHQLYGQVALKCYRNETAVCPFLVAGAGAEGEMEELWPEMFKRYERGLDLADLSADIGSNSRADAQ